MYHTQEKWDERLKKPILCKRDNAWLGIGFYFWKEEIDAFEWGINSKKRTGKFEIYSAEINCENVLDTVFNEEQYSFWIKQIEKVAKVMVKKTGYKPTIKEINAYFENKKIWKSVTGILFQDLPFSNHLLVKDFNYRKRIQIVVYNIEIINNFEFFKEDECF